MPILNVYADSKGPGTCRSCGAAITWGELTSGARMPFEGRDLVPVRTQGSMLNGDGRVVEEYDTSITPTHFEHCPDADKHRRRR